MKKIVTLIATLAMSLTLALPASAAGGNFQDVTRNHWAYNYVDRAASSGWVSGVGNGRYDPESQVTGAEFVTMITKSLYPSEVSNAQPGQAWYQGYVNTANAHGLLTHGMGSTAALNAPISRYNMAAVLFNVADECGILRPTSNGFLSTDESRRWSYSTAQFYIGDWASVPQEYQEAVLACYAMGLLSGNDARGSFGGSSSMTRAQAAVVLCRTYDGSTGQTTTDSVTGGITQEEAKLTALEHAGVNVSDATFHRVEEEWENGRSVYEVEFYVGNVEYDYEIDKTTGAIVSYDSDIEGWTPGNSNTGSTGGITQEEAKAIALEHAGVSSGNATFYRVKEDWENGRYVYEIEFYVGNVEYDYEIEKSTGKIVSYDSDIEGWAPSTPGTGSTGSITQEEAKAIALKHAGVSSGNATFYRVKEDWDDGRTVYEVEFYVGNVEYDYEIDKATGTIISYDSDIEGWAPSTPGTGSTGSLTLDEARNMVLAKVPGMTAQNVQIHQDYDDGRKVYEGEAWYNGREYEFEIDASTKQFLEWSEERW